MSRRTRNSRTASKAPRKAAASSIDHGAPPDYSSQGDDDGPTTPKETILPDQNLCRFYVLQNGNCRNGDQCRFSHDLKGLSFEDAKQYVPCPFFQKGTCKYGDHCQLSHVVTPKEEKKKNGEPCAICLEDVQELNRNFGLLSGCDHVFCHECVMEWRTEGPPEAQKSCPTCRKHSDFVVPSKMFPTNPKEKKRIVKTYKDNLSRTPCKRFTGELGSCRFGRDCFYAHLDEDGNDIKDTDRSMKEFKEERDQRRQLRRLEQAAMMMESLEMRNHIALGAGDMEMLESVLGPSAFQAMLTYLQLSRDLEEDFSDEDEQYWAVWDRDYDSDMSF